MNRDERLTEPTFNAKDVIAVAQALLEDHAHFETGDYSKDQFVCEYCGARTKEWSRGDDIDKIKHETWCAVLIARDLLTGSDEYLQGRGWHEFRR